MSWTIQQTKYAIETDEMGLTGDEFDSLDEARDHCDEPGDRVREMHYAVMEGEIVHRFTGTAKEGGDEARAQ